jgi:fibronectin type 3 domain-containing protein
LVWDPVAAGDPAGYAVLPAEAAGRFARLNKDLVRENFFNDETAQAGRRYRYVVRAVDTAGNMSVPSPEAVAEPL